MGKKRGQRSQKARQRRIERGVLLQSLAGSDLGKAVSNTELKKPLSESEGETITTKKQDGNTRTDTRDCPARRSATTPDSTARGSDDGGSSKGRTSGTRQNILLRVLDERHHTGATGIVNTKGVGQPFKFNGKRDQDFAEWSHKMRVYLTAKYGDKSLRLLQWSARQRRIVVFTNEMQSERMISWRDVFGEAAPEGDQIIGAEEIVSQLYTYLISFTTADANRVVRNAGEGQGLEAWRRLTNEYDPTSSMRRVTILGLVQNPPRCDRVENLGVALEEWLAKKRQY